jgi:hypothetical protein
VRLGSLFDLYQLLAALFEFTADASVDEDDIAIGIVATDLAFTFTQKSIIAHPVSGVMG